MSHRAKQAWSALKGKSIDPMGGKIQQRGGEQEESTAVINAPRLTGNLLLCQLISLQKKYIHQLKHDTHVKYSAPLRLSRRQ